MFECSIVVEMSLHEAQQLRKSFEDLCNTQEYALLWSLGIESETTDTNDDDSGNESDQITETRSEVPGGNIKCCFSSEDKLKENLAWSQYNWFDVVSNFLARCDGEDKVEAIILQLDSYYSSILISEMLDSEQRRLLQQSHDASVCDREGRLPLAWAQAAAVNGDIVTDSDSKDSEQYLGFESVTNETAKALILKKRRTLRRRAGHMKIKMFVEWNFLAWKQSRAVQGILKDNPDIERVIEDWSKGSLLCCIEKGHEEWDCCTCLWTPAHGWLELSTSEVHWTTPLEEESVGGYTHPTTPEHIQSGLWSTIKPSLAPPHAEDTS